MNPIRRRRTSPRTRSEVETLEGRRLPAATFGPVTVAATGFIDEVQVGDLNGDGRDDLIYDQVGASSGIYTLLSGPGGTFGTPVRVANSSAFGLGDFNGDGRLDLVVPTPDSGSVMVLPGRGDGTFGAPIVSPDINPGGAIYGISVADFNGDGRPDVLFEAPDPSSRPYTPPHQFAGLDRGDGTFAFSPVADNGDHPVLADLNGDGKADIASSGLSYSGGIFDTPGGIQYSLGDGTFSPVTRPGPLHYGIAPALAGDFNDDGRVDLVLLGGTEVRPGDIGGVAGVALYQGGGNFGPDDAPGLPYPGAPSWYGSPYYGPAAGDFDGDGRLDLLAIHADPSQFNPIESVALLAGHGDGSFTDPETLQTLPRSVYYHSLAVGDFNGDGKPDLVALTALYPTAEGTTTSSLLVQLNTTPWVTGGLDPASDSGTPGDNLTNQSSPTFTGQAPPGAAVTLSAQGLGPTDAPITARATAGADGSWRITLGPLGDGSYSVGAQAVAAGGKVFTADLAAASDPLVIATTPPVVSAVAVAPRSGQITATLTSAEVGLNLATLADPGVFALTNGRGRFFRIAGVSVAADPGKPGLVTLTATVAGGRLRPGLYIVRLRSADVHDVAGNALDGTFHKGLPSGGGHAGVDFAARFAVVGRHTTPLRPLRLAHTPRR